MKKEQGHVKEALLNLMGRGLWGAAKFLGRKPGRAIGLAVGPGLNAVDAAQSANRLGRIGAESRNISSRLLTDVSM
jgi:hypothetical protein